MLSSSEGVTVFSLHIYMAKIIDSGNTYRKNLKFFYSMFELKRQKPRGELRHGACNRKVSLGHCPNSLPTLYYCQTGISRTFNPFYSFLLLFTPFDSFLVPFTPFGLKCHGRLRMIRSTQLLSERVYAATLRGMICRCLQPYFIRKLHGLFTKRCRCFNSVLSSGVIFLVSEGKPQPTKEGNVMKKQHILRNILINLVITGLVLTVFSLFHHVLPRQKQSLGIVISNPYQTGEENSSSFGCIILEDKMLIASAGMRSSSPQHIQTPGGIRPESKASRTPRKGLSRGEEA